MNQVVNFDDGFYRLKNGQSFTTWESRHMRQPKPRNVWWLLFGISGISALGWFIHTFPPASTLVFIGFFAITAAASYFSALFILNSVRRAGLVSIGVITILFLRYIQLRQVHYIILLLAVLISLELMLQKR